MRLELVDINSDVRSNTSSNVSQDKIFLDYPTVETSITDLKSNLEDLKSIKDEFVSVTESMNNEWIGDGASAYETSCNTILEKIEESIKTLENEITDLTLRTNAIVQAEEYNRALADGGR